jgi:hypothetical protein
MGWQARANKAKERWGLMKSFCLGVQDLYLLRDTTQSSPHPVDAASGRQKGYSSDDLDSMDEVFKAIDDEIGDYRKQRRGINQGVERKVREIRKLEDRIDRAHREQLAYDQALELTEDLNEQYADRRVVVSLEGATMTWLADNWKLRTDWNGNDEVRSRIRAVTKALKDDNLIEWKAGEKEPTVDDFDKPRVKVKSEAADTTSNGAVASGADLVKV